MFGPREKLLEEAKRRITSKPGHYINHVYGENEFGGTSVIYISVLPLNETIKMPSEDGFERARLPQLAHESVPHLMHGWVLVTPFQFLGVSSGLGGWWFMKRRQRLMAERAQLDVADTSPDTPTPPSEG